MAKFRFRLTTLLGVTGHGHVPIPGIVTHFDAEPQRPEGENTWRTIGIRATVLAANGEVGSKYFTQEEWEALPEVEADIPLESA